MKEAKAKEERIAEKSSLLVSKLDSDDKHEESFEISAPGDKEDDKILEDLPLQMPVKEEEIKVEIKEEEPAITDSVFAAKLQAEINEEPKIEQVKQPEPLKPADPTDAYYARLLALNPAEKKYRAALCQLLEMGFSDFEKNLALLVASNGNVEQAA